MTTSQINFNRAQKQGNDQLYISSEQQVLFWAIKGEMLFTDTEEEREK